MKKFTVFFFFLISFQRVPFYDIIPPRSDTGTGRWGIFKKYENSILFRSTERQETFFFFLHRVRHCTKNKIKKNFLSPRDDFCFVLFFFFKCVFNVGTVFIEVLFYHATFFFFFINYIINTISLRDSIITKCSPTPSTPKIREILEIFFFFRFRVYPISF